MANNSVILQTKLMKYHEICRLKNKAKKNPIIREAIVFFSVALQNL
jgi:hypothetical protein